MKTIRLYGKNMFNARTKLHEQKDKLKIRMIHTIKNITKPTQGFEGLYIARCT